MQQILTLTTPLYLIIALGYLAVRFGVFEKAQMGVFGRFLLLVILPALVFRAIAQHPLAEVLNFHYFAVYALASLLAHGLGFAYARWFAGKSRAEAALYGMGMGTSNSVFVGYPHHRATDRRTCRNRAGSLPAGRKPDHDSPDPGSRR
jgi:malonate transporter